MQLPFGSAAIFLQVFLIFHVGVAVAGEWAYRNEGFGDPGVLGIHSVMAVATAFFLWKFRKENQA